jgi:hypothetical protein
MRGALPKRSRRGESGIGSRRLPDTAARYRSLGLPPRSKPDPPSPVHRVLLWLARSGEVLATFRSHGVTRADAPDRSHPFWKRDGALLHYTELDQTHSERARKRSQRDRNHSDSARKRSDRPLKHSEEDLNHSEREGKRSRGDPNRTGFHGNASGVSRNVSRRDRNRARAERMNLEKIRMSQNPIRALQRPLAAALEGLKHDGSPSQRARACNLESPMHHIGRDRRLGRALRSSMTSATSLALEP